MQVGWRGSANSRQRERDTLLFMLRGTMVSDEDCKRLLEVLLIFPLQVVLLIVILSLRDDERSVSMEREREGD